MKWIPRFPHLGQQPKVCQGCLILEVPRPHKLTPPSVGLLWTSDRLIAEACIWQHTTRTRNRHTCPRRDSNSVIPTSDRRRLSPRPLNRLDLLRFNCWKTPNRSPQPPTTNSYGRVYCLFENKIYKISWWLHTTRKVKMCVYKCK